MNENYKIIIADDHEIMLDGLAEIFNNINGFDIIDTAANGRQLIDKLNNKKADICLIDIDMPIMNGLEATEIISKKFPDVKVVILSMHKDISLIKKLKRSGAKAYLSKSCDADELEFVLKQITKGKTYFKNEYESSFIDEKIKTDIVKISKLTKREKEIVSLICDGLTNKEIAEKLFISSKTVDNHRTHIMEKLEVSNVVQLTRFCIENKLI